MTLSEDADYPDCPDCQTNVLVSKGRSAAGWHCHGCETWFDSSPTRRVSRGALPT